MLVSLVGTILDLVLANRSFSASLATALLRPNRAFAAVVLIAAAMLALAEVSPAGGFARIRGTRLAPQAGRARHGDARAPDP
ncbi:hypothetical protein [Sphingomonas sp. UNC305MFCol5.2]|uniref:hypothetical protein n=1 Tax=Sphingomonas sp. UNC305MFCol5.2 TaxID=1449076 RepID=UPI0004A77271|nr:hypothetical protein [Sphingomonas sp. UNC305MFCol5.2]